VSLYGFLQHTVRAFWHLVGPLHVRGAGNVPSNGPFLLIANHESYLDPILIQAVCPRPVRAMAKSTQFTSRFYRAIMVPLGAFPVRRFEIDPQAVRQVLRALEAGEGVCIYIEGERSWDARLQPPRLGTVRLILKAGVPVIPCAIRGSYDVMPRWDSRIRRAPVFITFGEPLRFPRLDSRADREAVLPLAASRITAAIQELLDQIPQHAPAGQ